MPDQSAHEQPPDDAALQRIADAIQPGAHPVNCERLAGGIDNAVFRLDIHKPGEKPISVNIRRHSDWPSQPASDKANAEWQVLDTLHNLGIPVPKPLLKDAAGVLSGSPGIIISYIEGSPNLTPSNEAQWAKELARPLADLHVKTVGMPPDQHFRQAEEWLNKYRSGPSDRERDHRRADEVWQELRAEYKHLETVQHCVLHFDYYAGNTVWRDDKLIAVIDWDGPAIGDPAYDVGYARMDLALQGRFDAADHFLAEYERLTKRPLANLRYYELLACIRAMPDPSSWLPGWNSFGMELTREEVRENLERYIDQVLTS